MENNLNALTLSEAIEQGYQFCNTEEGDGDLTKLADIKLGKHFWDPLETEYYVCDKEPRFHSISKDRVKELIQDDLDSADEFYSEDGFPEALEGCGELLEQLAKKINHNLGKLKFYFTTPIKLLPDYNSEQLTDNGQEGGQS